MLLHWIHILANLALKETVPPQPRTSTHVTVKNIYSIQWKMSGQTLFFRASASCSKILNVKYIFNIVKNFRANSVFQGKLRVAQKSWMVRNIFNTMYSVYIHLGVIRVIWASVVCNLDQSRDWL